MEEEIKHCLLNSQEKLNFFDKLVLRSIKQKSLQKCIYLCCKNRDINYYKYDGRYPFIPILGCTEFASAVFSIMNLVANLYGYFRYLKKTRGNNLLGFFYKSTFFINAFTWLSATFFHVNDTNFSRNLDYFFALLNLIFLFYAFLLRILLYHEIKNAFLLRSTFFTLIFYYFMHLFYMTFFNFDFILHKLVCAFLICNILGMFLFLILKYKKCSHIKYLFISFIGIGGSCLVEISDTPPLFYLIDSHALFHLITAFFTPFLYIFMTEDLIYLHKLE